MTVGADVGKLWCMPAAETAVTLLVPGDERSSLGRAKDRGAAAVALDLAGCEGAALAAARGDVVAALHADGWGDVRRMVRVNAWTTPHTYRDVIEVVEDAGAGLDSLVLPGVRSGHDVAALDRLLTQIEATMALPPGGIGIVAQLDDARGVQAAAGLAAASSRLRALLCNACDFAASVRLAAAADDLPAYCLAGDAAHVARARDEGFAGVWVDDPALVSAAAAPA